MTLNFPVFGHVQQHLSDHSHSPSLQEGLDGTSRASGGLVWLGGLCSWVARGRRQVGRRARVLLGEAPSASVAAVSADELVAGADRHWFHRADCLLARSRGWPASPRSEHERAGRQPCAACTP